MREEEEFDINKPIRIESFLKELDELIMEYHAEIYLNDDLFEGIEVVKNAAKEEMHQSTTPEIPGFEGTTNQLKELNGVPITKKPFSTKDPMGIKRFRKQIINPNKSYDK